MKAMRFLAVCAFVAGTVLCATVRAEEHAKEAVGPDGAAVWGELAAGNKRFMAGEAKPKDMGKTRATLTGGQHPQAIVLGCADSRVSPELVFDATLGELFVVRTAGNIADKVALGSIEYAVEHCGSPLIVVLGHESCGAVGAAAAGGKLPTDNLKAIVKQIDPALKEHRKAGLEGAMLVQKGVESNARLSAEHLMKASPIIREKVSAGSVKIVKAVYHLGSGEVTLLAD
jgi:carbonic anhydrase